MKIKRFFSVFAMGVMLFSLAGCSLARTDVEASAYEDRLIGVLVTTEYLDLFDFERYFNDHAGQFVNGGDVVVESTGGYQERIYAVLTTETLTDRETGEQYEYRNYVFDGISGIGYFAPRIEDEYGGYTGSSLDEGITDGHMDVVCTDEGDSLTLEGTIYVDPGRMDAQYYVNPVYQCADGAVYVTSGSGYMLSGDHGEGEVFSTTLDASTTASENGTVQTVSCSVTLHLAVMFPPEQIVLVQMDGESKVISRREYAPGEVPEVLGLEQDTVYLVVETHKRDTAGEETVGRELYQSDTTSIGTFYAREDGICQEQWTELKWNN